MALQQLKQLFNDAVNDGAFPGATYAIILKDKIYTDFVGNKAKYPELEPNAVDTIYDMASVTKVSTTTTCLLKLMEMGKLRLFDKVNKYLPRFRHENITVYNLVTHTSGLKIGLSNPSSIKSSEEAWDKVYESDVHFDQGTHIEYSDLNYILLGKIVEVISGLPLDQFALKYIYQPLEMVDTCYNPKDKKRTAPTEERNDEIVRGIVRGNVHDETAYIMNGVSGHAGMFSTAHDMANFLQMLLNQGMFKNQQYLSPITVDRLFKPLVTERVGVSTMPLTRSIGWIVSDYNSCAGDLTSDETISHTGFTGTCVWVDRVNEVAFCMLSNRVHITRQNAKHIEVRSKIANFIMANLKEIKEEIYNGN